MLVSLILYICGHEDADTVYETACVLAGCNALKSGALEADTLECIVAAAENAEKYKNRFTDMPDMPLRFIDLSFRNYQSVAQLKNAALSYAAGDCVIFVQPQDIWQEDTFSLLMQNVHVKEMHAVNGSKAEPGDNEGSGIQADFDRLIMAGDSNVRAFAFSKAALLRCGGFNGRLGCGEEFEAALRIFDSGCGSGFVIDEDSPKPVYQEHYNTYAYIIGRYAARLRKEGIFDTVLMRYVKEAQGFGIEEYFCGQLEKMVSKQKEYYAVDDAARPVLIYMGDPICFDVLISFARSFANELERHGIPVIIYDMAEEGTTGLAEFVGERFRAVVGFQTALYSVRMKNSEELVNNKITGPKINFLYDHPLYLYYHFTLELNDYYVLTQDEDYAGYINRHYPLIKRSFHLPPAGIELKKGQHVEWKDKIYDIVFVASYHDYRERMLALEMQTDPQAKPSAKKLFEKMKAKPNMTAEEALKEVLAQEGKVLNDDEFGSLLNKCMDACRAVMFYYREKVMEALLDSGIAIHAFGESWKNCPLACRSNLIIHPDVSYMEGIRIMAQSKIALNVMSWHKAGMTERIANTMLNGTVCLTDRTKYLERHFTDGADIVMFNLEKLEELPAKVKMLLCDNVLMQKIAAAGYDNAAHSHRWKNRAEKFIDMLDNGVFEE